MMHAVRIVSYFALALLVACRPTASAPPAAWTDLYPIKIGKHYGYINASGQVVIAPRFYRVNHWGKHNRVVVETAPGQPALLDTQGNLVFQDTSGFLYRDYQDGLVKFETVDKKICFIDSLGTFRFCLPDSVLFAESAFSCERLLVRYRRGVLAYLDPAGKEVYRFRRGFPGNYSEDIVRRNFDGRTCYFDKNGKRLFCVKGSGSDCHSGVMMITAKNNRYLVNKKGEKITDTLPYDAISEFLEGYALVTKNKKMGAINTAGQEIIPLQYHRMTPFVNGLAFVPHGRQWQLINTRHEVVSRRLLDEVVFPGFVGNLAYVLQDTTWGYINKKGAFVWKSKE